MINPQMLIQLLPVLQGNPVGMLINRGFNVPQGQNMDPREMTEYLMNSGQVDQNVYNNAVKTAKQMGYKL